jgi:uncharacterized membrane protein YGL010W
VYTRKKSKNNDWFGWCISNWLKLRQTAPTNNERICWLVVGWWMFFVGWLPQERKKPSYSG